MSNSSDVEVNAVCSAVLSSKSDVSSKCGVGVSALPTAVIPKEDVDSLSDDDAHGTRLTAAKSKAAKAVAVEENQETLSETTLSLPGLGENADDGESSAVDKPEEETKTVPDDEEKKPPKKKRKTEEPDTEQDEVEQPVLPAGLNKKPKAKGKVAPKAAKAKAKAKSKGTAEAKVKAEAKSKSSAKKTLPPPNLKDDRKPVKDDEESKTKKKKTLPPPKPVKDDSEADEAPPMKRPAARSGAAKAAPKMKATKYMYHASQKWGIKLNGREQMT
eukprot:symbB.v1.2.037269.t1/scaffold5458.1/size26918/1